MNFVKQYGTTVLLLIGVVGFYVWRSRPPEVPEGKVPAIEVALLAGERLDLSKETKPRAVVFWATWCGPCTVELRRLQAMIDRKQIEPQSVVAISSGEEAAVVQKEIEERKYTFTVALDREGAASRQLGVSATPTIFLVEPGGKIHWSSVGVSPTLELRVANFVNESKD